MRIRNAVSVIAGVLLLAVPAIAAPVKVALVLDKGGRDDKSFNAAAFRDKVDNGRKVAIQVLEFFDRHGVTTRRGDLRTVRADRVNLFGRPEGK